MIPRPAGIAMYCDISQLPMSPLLDCGGSLDTVIMRKVTASALRYIVFKDLTISTVSLASMASLLQELRDFLQDSLCPDARIFRCFPHSLPYFAMSRLVQHAFAHHITPLLLRSVLQ